MKKITALLFILASLHAGAQKRSLEKIWQTDSVIAVPESVLPDATGKTLYVSLINGGGWDVDGKGGVGRMSPDGKKHDSTWITDLHAPKGMCIQGNKLYVADIDNLVVIDIAAGKIVNRIPFPGAKGLNDVTISKSGTIYVSDSRVGQVWKMEGDVPALYIDTVKGVNGVKAVGDDLYIGAGKIFKKADKNKLLTQVAEVPQNIDGIEPVGNGDFILTSWPGYIYYVTAGGEVELLLDTHLEPKNTADIGYNPKQKIVYVPTFNAKTVVAYRLK